MIHQISSLIIEKENKIAELYYLDNAEYDAIFKQITLEYKIKIQKVIDNNTQLDANT